MAPAPLHQPDGMITQVRQACGAGRVRINGVCVARTTKRQVRRQVRRCGRWHGGVCVRWYFENQAGEDRAAVEHSLNGFALKARCAPGPGDHRSGPDTCQRNPLGGGRDDQSWYSTSVPFRTHRTAVKMGSVMTIWASVISPGELEAAYLSRSISRSMKQKIAALID